MLERIGAAIGLALLASTGAAAQTGSSIPTGSRQAWIALLHYWSTDGSWASEVQDPSFFLSIDGARDPEKEWDADRTAFLSSATQESPGRHAQCRFPARFALMKKALEWTDRDVKVVECPGFDAYRERLKARSVSVVFVSHYLNNPASAFGHAMLYLGSGGDRNAMLTNYSVSFEADTKGMPPSQYLPRGLIGHLVASYRVAPLYERVRKYQREEQRDLWLFPLDMAQDQIDQLVRHLWELHEVTFQYGFFEGNCAQKILAVLHAVVPEYGLLPYNRPAVLPQEITNRLVDRIGLAGEPMRWPSISSEYNRRVASLTRQEHEQLEEILTSRSVTPGVSPATLSAALLWSEMETPYRAFRRAAETSDDPDLVWRRELWASRITAGDRGEARGANSDVRGDVLSRPVRWTGESVLEAHRPTRVRLASGHLTGRGAVVEVGARWLLHGVLDPEAGYPPLSTVEVARVDVDVSRSGEVSVDEATVLRLEKLGPASSLDSHVAWKIDIGARRLPIDNGLPLLVGLEGGIGAGAALRREAYSLALYSMIGARPSLAVLRGRTTFVPAGIGSVGLVMRLPGDIRARVSGEYSLSLGALSDGSTAVEAVLRKGLMRDWDLEMAVNGNPVRSGFTVGVVSFR